MSEYFRLIEEVRNNPKAREVIRVLLHLTVVFALFLILIRAMPYDAIKKMHLPFIKFENVCFPIMLFFMIIMAMAPFEETERFFVAPNGARGSSDFHYQRRDVLVVILVSLFSCIYLLAIYNKELPDLDESWILTMSDRILHHEIPYRDFFTLTSPGSVYLNAWIFRVFGTSIIVERTATLVLGVFGTALIYFLARLRMGYFFAVSACLLYLTWQFPLFFQASYSWYAIVCSMCAFFVMSLVIRNRESGSKKLILVGALCSICFIFKQNIGALTLIAITLYFPTELILFDKHTERRLLFPLYPTCFGVTEIKTLIRKYLLLALGFAIPLGVCAYAFYSKGALTDFLHGVFIVPMRNSQDYHYPYVALTRLTDKRVMMYMPHFMLVATFFLLARRFRRASLEDKDRFPLLMALAMLFTHFSTYPRADFTHIVFSLWPSIILMAYWTQEIVVFALGNWQSIARPFSFSPSLEIRLRSLGVIFLAFIPLLTFWVHRTGKNISFEKNLIEVSAGRGQGIYGNPYQVKELDQMIAFVEECSDCDRSEVTFSATPLLYFLASRRNYTPYDYIIEGNGPSGYEKDILAFLKERKPCMVILDTVLTNYYPTVEDWDKIEKYIYSTYEIAFDSARYKVLLPTGSSSDTVRSESEKILLAGQDATQNIKSQESSPAL